MAHPNTHNTQQRKIRGEPGIGIRAAGFLGARDRTNLHLGLRMIDTCDRDKICLPTGDVFRTLPQDDTGCGSFTSLDATECCVQDDIHFCANVAAIMRDAFEPDQAGGIVQKMYAWIRTVKTEHIPENMEVTIQPWKADHQLLLELAMLVQATVTLNIEVRLPNEDLNVGFSKLASDVHVRASEIDATVSFDSMANILTNDMLNGTIQKLLIHCPLDMTGVDIQHVVDLINECDQYAGVEYAFTLPPAIPVRAVGAQLIDSPHLGVPWVARPRRHNGPKWTEFHRSKEVGYDLDQNRITVVVI